VFIVTAKVSRRKLALWGLAAAALCCCIFVAGLGISHLTGDVATGGTAGISSKGIKTNEDRLNFLQAYGWTVNEEPLATEELLIPAEFDESYSDYLALQSEQGFDLTKYAGKRVKRYTYEITNYPTGETGVQVNLLIYKNTVIGGEVLSAQLDGFLHGLAAPS